MVSCRSIGALDLAYVIGGCILSQSKVKHQSVIRGTYAMISPDGRFFDSTSGCHLYNEPILKVGIEKARSQVSFSQEGFNDRTSSYVDNLMK